jgi:hypothetical protein
MWSKIEFEGFDVGDAVEIIGLGLERELFIGEISGMYFLKRKGRVAFDHSLLNMFSVNRCAVNRR